MDEQRNHIVLICPLRLQYQSVSTVITCVTVPGVQHCRGFAPEHLSARYRPWQMNLLGWQMPPSSVQLMSLLGRILLPVFLTFFLRVTVCGLPLFAVV